MTTLFLASDSASRKKLLADMGLTYEILRHTANEEDCDVELPLESLVLNIAQAKMEHAVLPSYEDNQEIFVITADTLGTDVDGIVHGKPKDRTDAQAKIKAARKGKGTCATGFCIEKKIYNKENWQTTDQIARVVTAEYIFEVPDEWIERYLDNSPALRASGAIAIEGFGLQFLKMIHGSFSTIVGLPLFEVRQALEELDFFSN